MFDHGRILVVTRKQFKHWIVFLDALTDLLRTATAVRRLFTTQGIPVHHVSLKINNLEKTSYFQFDDLETNGEYVAVETGPFVNVPYGQARFTLRLKVGSIFSIDTFSANYKPSNYKLSRDITQ